MMVSLPSSFTCQAASLALMWLKVKAWIVSNVAAADQADVLLISARGLSFVDYQNVCRIDAKTDIQLFCSKGNVVVWKASDTSMLSSYICYKIMREAGVPAGVVNFVPADGPVFGDAVVKSPLLAGINFTGSAK